MRTLLDSRGLALCVADTEEAPAEDPLGVGSLGYLRLRRAAYDDDLLAGFVERIQGQDWERAFVFFKHEDDGAGPLQALEFSARFPAAREG